MYNRQRSELYPDTWDGHEVHQRGVQKPVIKDNTDAIIIIKEHLDSHSLVLSRLNLALDRLTSHVDNLHNKLSKLEEASTLEQIDKLTINWITQFNTMIFDESTWFFIFALVILIIIIL